MGLVHRIEMFKASKIVRRCQDTDFELKKALSLAMDADVEEDVRVYARALIGVEDHKNQIEYYSAKKRYYQAKLWLPQGAEERMRIIYKIRNIPSEMVNKIPRLLSAVA